jgi:hypothetical protein
MAGAVVTHVRAHQGLAKMIPALVSLGLLVAIVVLAR